MSQWGLQKLGYESTKLDHGLQRALPRLLSVEEIFVS
jgi:hypothetical protein